jgi:hypothetical protein
LEDIFQRWCKKENNTPPFNLNVARVGVFFMFEFLYCGFIFSKK